MALDGTVDGNPISFLRGRLRRLKVSNARRALSLVGCE
jgi:hypothetical protein